MDKFQIEALRSALEGLGAMELGNLRFVSAKTYRELPDIQELGLNETQFQALFKQYIITVGVVALAHNVMQRREEDNPAADVKSQLLELNSMITTLESGQYNDEV